MRILVMTPWTGFWEVGERGGVPDEYLTFRGLVERGHEVHVAAPRGARYELEGRGRGALHVHEVPYPARRWSGRLRGQLGRLRDLAAAHRAYRGRGAALVRTLHPDLILAHTFHTAPSAAAVGARFGVPVVAKFFGVVLLERGRRLGVLHMLRHIEHVLSFRSTFARIIVLDDGTAGDEVAIRLGAAPDRLLFWPNGLNVEWAELPLPAGGGDPAARARLGLDPGAIYTLTLARLFPLKRVERVLGMIAALRRQGCREVRALIGGDGVMRERLEAEAARLGLGEGVRFLGGVDHDRVPEVMAAADVYVSPHDLTNANIPTCEAMLCKLPVVAMDAGTTRRVVADGETGLVVPRGDVEALAAAVRRLAADPDLRRRLGKRGHEIARERFVSWEERVRMEIEVLESVARVPPGSGTSRSEPSTPPRRPS